MLVAFRNYMAGFTANASGCYLTMGRSVPDRTDFDLLPAPHSTRVSAWQSQVDVNHRQWSRSVQLVGAPTYRLRSGHRLRVSADPRCLRRSGSRCAQQGRSGKPKGGAGTHATALASASTCGQKSGLAVVCKAAGL